MAKPTVHFSDDLHQAVRDVLAERRRQVLDEGYSEQRDDGYARGELVMAAVAYAANAGAASQVTAERGLPLAELNYAALGKKPPSYWPWRPQWWKPKSPRRDLVRAAALLIAEIERLDRAEAREKSNAMPEVRP